MDFSVVLVFIGVGLLNFFGWWNATRVMISEIGINPKFFPRHYTMPARFIKKLFRIKSKKIPRYLHYMCYVTIVYFFLGFVELLLYYAVEDNGNAAGRLLLAHVIFVIINAVIFLVLSTIFKHNQRRRLHNNKLPVRRRAKNKDSTKGSDGNREQQ